MEDFHWPGYNPPRNGEYQDVSDEDTYQPYKSVSLEEVEDFKGLGATLWERDRFGIRPTTKEKYSQKNRTLEDERLDKLRLQAFHEKLDSAAEETEWNDPGVDRRVVYHHSRSRPKPKSCPADQDQVGVTLELGEFQDVRALTVSEAAVILNAIHSNRKRYGVDVIYTNAADQ